MEISSQRMQMIAQYFIVRPVLCYVIAITTVLLGIIAIYLIPISEFPDIAPPQVQVVAYYPGASAALIQSVVASPIEEEVNGVDGMLYMSSSSSSEGTYTLTITFTPGTNADIATVNVQNRVSVAESELPEVVTELGVSTTSQNSDIMQAIIIYSPESSYNHIFISNYVTNRVENSLTRINGVGSTSQFSRQNYSMRIWLDPIKMASLNLSVSDIYTAVEEQNIMVAPGKIGGPPFENQDTIFQFTLESDGLLETSQQFENIIVLSNGDGSVTKLKDVAIVTLGAESYSAASYYNGYPAALVAVYEEAEANALFVSESVRDEMARIATEFPDDLEYEVVYDISENIIKSVKEIIYTLLITVFIVILIILISLKDIRSAIIVAIAIPVSLLGAIFILYLVGFTVNMITLFALVLAIPLVVDDAIVILENTQRIIESERVSVHNAVLKSMSQITRPIIATTFVLAAVFIPVCFFPGITGNLYREFALTIIFAFMFSTINALTLVPVLCSSILSINNITNKNKYDIMKILCSKYVFVLDILLNRLWLSWAIYLIVFTATIYMFFNNQKSFVPQEDNGVLFINSELPVGASLERTKNIMREISIDLQNEIGVESVTTVAGYSILSGSQANVGMGIVLLSPWDQRQTAGTSWSAIMRSLNLRLSKRSDATFSIFPLPSIPGIGTVGGVSAELLDESRGKSADLEAVKNGLLSALRKKPELQSAVSGFSASSPQYQISLDRARAETLQVSVYDIYLAIEAAFGSVYVNNFVLDNHVYWVVISTQSQYRQQLLDMNNIYVNNSNGIALPLNSFVTITPTLGSETIYRYNLYESAGINVQAVPGISSGAAIETIMSVSDSTLPDGYSIAWTGISLQEVEARNLIFYIILLSVVFSYLFIAVHYESWIIPISIIASTIFAAFGAILPLYFINGVSNNIYSQIGIVLLIGLAAKKAIIVIEFATKIQESGFSIHDAARMAAQERFRAVTMTGICFVVGAVPLMLAGGVGAAGRMSIGFPVFFGMLIDSSLGLLMIPVLYLSIEKIRNFLKCIFQ
ncbi:efflux RND transporter permease subunit [Roseibium sp. RKSG952]|uniref:efflux RND transporter permease subunit n=1 Tax=Roseibium sp. RKSG952 TaxID=2529384 RepID=UPI0012BBFB1F|nr:efflux RND transporter permease subunit [Roseibium sp. RKSG952]MTH95060.1 efflux RND transporter permease subunit [Roseibium sp. RKSG952]